jgi:HAD superfamily hydrolase (TIGR01509 family)
VNLVSWSDIQAVIFDVDGTLYHQPQLRAIMARQLALHLLKKPWAWREVQLLKDFRALREQLTAEPDADLGQEQYQRVAQRRGVSPALVKATVEKWMQRAPLPHLAACRRTGVRSFFQELRQQGKAIAVFSDYPAREKMRAMGLSAQVVVCADDPRVNRLKPDPKGLLTTAQDLGVEPGACLYVGDRDQLDGEAARRAGMAYLIWEPKPTGRPHRFGSFGQLQDDLTGHGSSVRGS